MVEGEEELEDSSMGNDPGEEDKEREDGVGGHI